MGAHRCSMHHEVKQGKSAHKLTGIGHTMVLSMIALGMCVHIGSERCSQSWSQAAHLGCMCCSLMSRVLLQELQQGGEIRSDHVDAVKSNFRLGGIYQASLQVALHSAIDHHRGCAGETLNQMFRSLMFLRSNFCGNSPNKSYSVLLLHNDLSKQRR